MSCRAAMLLVLFAAAPAMFAGRATAEAKFDSNTFGGLEARAIGPAVMGGRIAALDIVG